MLMDLYSKFVPFGFVADDFFGRQPGVTFLAFLFKFLKYNKIVSCWTRDIVYGKKKVFSEVEKIEVSFFSFSLFGSHPFILYTLYSIQKGMYAHEILYILIFTLHLIYNCIHCTFYATEFTSDFKNTVINFNYRQFSKRNNTHYIPFDLINRTLLPILLTRNRINYSSIFTIDRHQGEMILDNQ